LAFSFVLHRFIPHAAAIELFHCYVSGVRARAVGVEVKVLR
jgi:hypothetical protein